MGPSGHFLGAEHTQARYKTAFYSPFLSDWSNFETWEEGGSVETARRANRLFRRLLDEYQLPPMDPGTLEALTAFVEKRRAAGGAPTDF